MTAELRPAWAPWGVHETMVGLVPPATAVTVTPADPVIPSVVARMLAVPAETAVIKPDWDTLTTDALVEDQAKALPAITAPFWSLAVAVNCRISRKMALREIAPDDLPTHLDGCDLIVDAIFGTGLDGRITGAAATVIDRINDSGRPVLAVDVPSGLDCDSGEPLGSAVTATRTVTFVAHKPAMNVAAARKHFGQVVVADIGAPVELLERLGRRVDI